MELLTIPVITALTQIFKWDLNKRLVPFISIWIWILISLLLTIRIENPDYIQCIIDWRMTLS